MHVAYLIALIVLLALAFWTLTAKFRRAEDIESILQNLHPGLPDAIYDQVEVCGDDEELWALIGGWKGLRMLVRNTGLFVSAVRILAEQFPKKAHEEYRELWWKAVYLRLCFIGCALECLAKRLFPIPRVQARECVRLYCDVTTSFESLLEVCDPKRGEALMGKFPAVGW